MRDVPFARHESVRVGFIGVGGRGQGLLHNALGVEGVQVVAIADAWEPSREGAVKRVIEAGQHPPRTFADYEDLCAQDDIDLVVIGSRWDDHVPQAVAAMESGKHAAVEVPAATTLADCWKLVETSERTRKHCVILENCCYGWSEMLVLNLVKAGVLGELTHGEAAYIHDLRSLLLADHSEGLWRREPHKTRDANHYPTHGLGPVARYLDIHRGDRFTRLVSMSSQPASLKAWGAANLPEDSPKRSETYVAGDMNSSLLQTAQGRTVLLQHDVVTPRPYSRLNLIQGTKGTFADYPPRIFVDGKSEHHDWQSLDDYKEFEDPLWTNVGELARKLGGHGGMDFLMLYDLIQSMRDGAPPRIDVYDAAVWSAPYALSESSIAGGNVPVEFPDFTRGHWQ